MKEKYIAVKDCVGRLNGPGKLGRVNTPWTDYRPGNGR